MDLQEERPHSPLSPLVQGIWDCFFVFFLTLSPLLGFLCLKMPM